MLLLLALALAATPPAHPGTFRRAARATDGTHVALFLYQPERPLPGAPLVVLLPDLGAAHDFFDLRGQGLAPALVARGYPVVTLDWRGIGVSEAPLRPATLDDLLEQDLPLAADVQGPERQVVLVGWGYSGALAYAAAAGPLAPRVKGVVTFNGVVDADVPNTFVERMLAPHAPLDLSRALASPAPQHKRTLFRLLWTHRTESDADLAAELLSHAMGVLSGPQVTQLDGWLHTGATTLGGRSYPGLIDDVRAPVLAFSGLRDNWTHPEFAGAIRDHVPEARLTFRPVNRFEGFTDDVGHVGLVLSATAEKELVPLVDGFIRTRAMAVPEARR